VGFDVGFGSTSFARDRWQLAHDHGLQDYTISSDSWGLSGATGALTLANVLTSFLKLGLPLADSIYFNTSPQHTIKQRPSGRHHEGRAKEMNRHSFLSLCQKRHTPNTHLDRQGD
jgi:predicted amidohydrolase